jgi:hypothetical protein
VVGANLKQGFEYFFKKDLTVKRIRCFFLEYCANLCLKRRRKKKKKTELADKLKQQEKEKANVKTRKEHVLYFGYFVKYFLFFI